MPLRSETYWPIAGQAQWPTPKWLDAQAGAKSKGYAAICSRVCSGGVRRLLKNMISEPVYRL